jgi:probable phosphoglycerate mutase
MELLLIRHALPVRVEGANGAADPQLSDIGQRQSTLVAEYLQAETVHALYASPLRRAVETAAFIGRLLNLPTAQRDGLAEWDRNAPEYIPVEELKAANDPRWHALVAGDWEGDEPREVFHRRVADTIEAIIADHRGERVAIVCHGGVINSYLATILGIDGANGFFYPDYTSIHRVAAASSGERSVVTLNENAHLRNAHDLRVGLR